MSTTCRNCGSEHDGKRDLCSACLSRTPACVICSRPIDDHQLTYSTDKYPQPICPPKGQPIPKKEA